MDTIQIPVALIDSAEYQSLSWGCREFLIGVYAAHADCSRFTLDWDRPEQYRQSPGVWLQRKIAQLVKAGLIEHDGFKEIRGRNATGGYRVNKRVFRFKYPVSH